MYLFYDNQGNLISANNQDIVVQNSNNANFIFVNIQGIDYAQYSAIATFEVPSASADTVQLVITNNLTTIDYGGKKIQGYIIWLNDAITYYTGDVKFTLSLTKLGTSTRLNLQEFIFHVDESTTSGEPWDAYINQAQYENIMNYITGGKLSFEYLGEFPTNQTIIPESFHNKFGSDLLKEHSQGYYLIFLDYDRNGIVSSYINYDSDKGTVHFVYIVYRNYLTNQFEAVGYKEIFNLDDDNYFDYEKGTKTTSGTATWNDDGTATLTNSQDEVSITLPISEIGLNVGEHVIYSFNASGGGGAAGFCYAYLLDENLEELKKYQFSWSGTITLTNELPGIELVENTKFIKLVVNKATQSATILSNFSINKYKEVMLPTTLTPDSVEYIEQYSTNYQTLINTINQNISTINSDITSLEQGVSSLQQDITEVKEDITTINTTLGTLPYTCELTMNSSTYVITLNLKDAKGTTLSTQSVDLPLESTIIGGSYDESNKAIILTLKSGETISIPIGDLVDGLVSQTEFDDLENKVNSIDNRLSNLEDMYSARIGITSQYVSQPSDVKEGSNIYINAKLRDSVNLYNPDGLVYETTSKFSYTVTDDGKTIVGTANAEMPANETQYIRVVKQLTDWGFNVGETITFSALGILDDSTKRYQLGIRCVDSSSTQLLYKESGSILSEQRCSVTLTIPEGTVRVEFYFRKAYTESYSNGFTFTFTDIQLQKGNEATAYEPYGAYSKGKVMQYASKNILNLPSCTAVSMSSVNGSQTSSDTYERASASNSLQINMRGSQTYAKYVKGHKYALLIHSTDNDFSEFTTAAVSLLGSDGSFIVNTVGESFVTGTPNVYAIIVTWITKTQIGRLQPYFVGGKSLSITVDERAVIDLTSAGLHEYDVRAVDELSISLETLASGGSISMGYRRSPLIKTFDNNLYLTKPNTYTLTIYEFKENPKSLNAEVDIDDYELIKVSEYSSSGAITLTPSTNSIVYFFYASSSTDLSSWQAASQLEYGNEATEHSDYIAPIEIGTFDKEVDGNEKTFSFVVLGTENQNVGFIPASENDISIDFAKNVSDLTSSTFAYQSTNIASTVAQLTQRVETLESQMSDLETTTINEINTKIETLQGSISTDTANIEKIESRRNMYPKKWKAKLLRFQSSRTVMNKGVIRLNFLSELDANVAEEHRNPYGVIKKELGQKLLGINLPFTMVFAMGYNHKTRNGVRKMGDKWGFSINGAYPPRTFMLNSASKPNITLDELATKVLQLIDPNCVIDSNIVQTNMPSWWKFPFVGNATYQNNYKAPQNAKGGGEYPFRAYKVNFLETGLFNLEKLAENYNNKGTTYKARCLDNYFNAYCKRIMRRHYDNFIKKKDNTGDDLHRVYPLIRLEISFIYRFNSLITGYGRVGEGYKLFPDEFSALLTTDPLVESNKMWTGKLQNLWLELFMKFDNSNLDETIKANKQADCCYVWWRVHNRK